LLTLIISSHSQRRAAASARLQKPDQFPKMKAVLGRAVTRNPQGFNLFIFSYARPAQALRTEMHPPDPRQKKEGRSGFGRRALFLFFAVSSSRPAKNSLQQCVKSARKWVPQVWIFRPGKAQT
jgi:hypothetical protein